MGRAARRCAEERADWKKNFAKLLKLMSRPFNFSGIPTDHISYSYHCCGGLCRDDCAGKHDDGSSHVFGYAVQGSIGIFMLLALGVGVIFGILLMIPALIGHSVSAMQNKRKIAELESKPSRKKAN